MLKDISSIKLQGANFLSETILPVFEETEKKFTKVSLIYGRNGSGKSTIAKAFKKLKGEEVTTVITADVLDSENQEITLCNAERESIFVFDEDFISKNVLIEGNGLGSIVMLGEQADLTLQIEQAEREFKKAEALVKTTSETLAEYQITTNPNSPQFYIKKMHDVLQHDNGWAGREREVKGLRRNASVNNETYKRFIGLVPEKSRDELIIDFNIQKKELDTAKSGVSLINTSVPSINDAYKNYSTALANELIRIKLEKPELSDREKYLISLVMHGQTSDLQERITFFQKKESVFCPYCLQDITTNYKMNLIMQIQKVLTDEVKQHQEQLKQLLCQEFNLELSPFSTLSSYHVCIDLMDIINATLIANNSLLNRKIENPYSPIIGEELSEIGETLQTLEEALKKLEEERKNHNRKAVRTQPIIDALVSINNQIAYYDVIDFSKQYYIQEEKMRLARKAYDNAVFERDQKRKFLEELNGRRKRVDIAVDIINNGLKYISFSENGLTIKRDGDFYNIFSKGRPVLPREVSVGERNMIGLCYFFTSIMSNQMINNAYQNEYLIVIDDPISSYDFENKVGIFSFMRHKLGQFLNGNVNSRAIIMTHDLMTLFDLQKVFKELNDGWKNIFRDTTLKYHTKELKNCDLYKFENCNWQEYTELIKLVYEYGRGNANEYNLVIGNIIRQVLEAFATFEYKKGIEKISTDTSILTKLCDEHKSYFQNLMYRIVLNNGSHRKEQVNSMDINFFSVISESEKRRTAQEIICFIYLLNKEHVLAHLGDVRNTIDQWCEEIKHKAVVI